MGFLDHSTNNIIVDAVLTKKGREYLAKNNGEFNIQTFSLGDDEVDYNIIKQYGRTVGKEKIEKNTPVMEATTSGSPIKYPLITISEPIIFYPTITADSPSDFKSTEVLEIGVTGSPSNFNTSEQLKFIISTSGNRVTANSFSNNVYRVEMDSRLLKLTTGGVAESTDTFDKRTFYIVKANSSTASGNASLNNSELTMTLGVTDNINTSTTEFSKYQVSGETFIRTFVRISSNQTGLSKIFEVKINAKTNA